MPTMATPVRSARRRRRRGAALTEYALTLSVLVGSALGGINLVRDQSGDFLVETGGQIGDRRMTREEIAAATIPIAPDWIPTTTTTMPTTTTAAPTTAAPTTAAPTTTAQQASNLAIGKPATMSSRYSNWSGGAELSFDGNTNGNFQSGSVSHSNYQTNPNIGVDLQASKYIESINIWNRTDCCSYRTKDVWVIVSDSPISNDLNWAKWSQGTVVYLPGQVGVPSTVPIAANGRYVKIFIQGAAYLHLAEVEVNGWP